MSKKVIKILFASVIVFSVVTIGILYFKPRECERNLIDNKLQREPASQPVATKGELVGDIPGDPNNPLGMINKVYEQNGTWYLEIDQFKIYFADSDLEEAIEDGVCPNKDECDWPNNFAIGNKDDIITTYVVSPEVTIDLSGLEPYRNMWSEEAQEWLPLFPINPTLPEFSALLNGDSPYGLHAGGAFGIVLVEGIVTNIYGIYLP